MPNAGENVAAFPLSWPIGWTRVTMRLNARFGHKGQGPSRSSADYRLRDELRKLGARGVTVSTNLPVRRDGLADFSRPEPYDTGVAVYFRIKNQPRVFACDKWRTIADNMTALAKHVEAIRGQGRWGVGSVEQALGGYLALTALPAKKAWHEVLEVAPDANRAVIDAARERLLMQHHPDKSGTSERVYDINAAYDELRDLERLGQR